MLRDPFWVWCQYHAPRGEAVNEVGRYEQMRYRRGVEHEDAWVAAHYPDALAIKPDFGYEALARTLRAMLEGVPPFTNRNCGTRATSYGRGDLLVRDDSHGSDLGPYHYRVIEIKRARSSRDAFALQAALYNRTIGAVQGYTPGHVTVALRDEAVPWTCRVSGTRLTA